MIAALLISSLGLGSCCTSRTADSGAIPVDNGERRRQRIEETRRQPVPREEPMRQQSAEEETLPAWGSNAAERIKADVLFALSLEPRIADNLIDAEYDRGYVRLIGTVDSEDERTRAFVLASNVPGVRQVILDELRVAGTE